MASSGIAALLLTGGKTAHSRFKIPLDITKDSTCGISKQLRVAQLLLWAVLTVWDELPMMHGHVIEAVDRLLRDIMDSDQPFCGKVMLLAGDFPQILPVISKATRAQVVRACLKKSPLWAYFKTLTPRRRRV